MRVNRYFFIFLISIFCFELRASDFLNKIVENPESYKGDAFYILDVGEGNCQFSYLAEQKIGFLYDCGSKAQQVPHKIKALRSTDFQLLFKTSNHDLSEKKKTYEDTIFDRFSTPLNKKSKKEIQPSTKMSGRGKEKSFQDSSLKDNVRNIISSYQNDMHHLFIVASHPDADHINWIPFVIPESTPVTVFLEGDWLRKKSEKEDELSLTVNEVINSLLKRKKSNSKNTHIIMPYYWPGFSIFEKEYLSYSEIVNTLETYGPNTIYEKFKSGPFVRNQWRYKECFYTISESIVQNLKCLGYEDEKIKYFIRENYYNFFQEEPDAHFPGHQYLSSNRSSLLKNKRNEMLHNARQESIQRIFSYPTQHLTITGLIEIDHISFPMKDSNEQSAIVYLNIPSLEMGFFLTGDGSSNTFTHHISHNQGFYKQLMTEKNTNLLMLPHHGSKENDSQSLIQKVHPHVIGISAGSGQHGHPSRELIHEIDRTKKFLGEQIQEFKSNFDIVGPKNNSLIHFENKKKSQSEKNEYIPYVKKISNNDVQYLCTNTLGSIRIDQEGIWVSFSNIISGEKDMYVVDYTNISNALKLNNIEEIEKNIYESKGNYYFLVEEGENDVFYPATILGSTKDRHINNDEDSD